MLFRSGRFWSICTTAAHRQLRLSFTQASTISRNRSVISFVRRRTATAFSQPAMSPASLPNCKRNARNSSVRRSCRLIIVNFKLSLSAHLLCTSRLYFSSCRCRSSVTFLNEITFSAVQRRTASHFVVLFFHQLNHKFGQERESYAKKPCNETNISMLLLAEKKNR